MQKSFQASWEAINFDSPSQKTNQRASTAQLIVPQKEYHVEFLPRYPGAKIKEVKLIQRKGKTDTGAQESTSLQARLQGKTLLSSELSFLQNIPKEQDPKRILSQALGKAGEKVSEPQYFYQELPSALATEQSLIHFSVPTTGEYQLFAVDNNNNVHSLAFKTQLQTKNMRLTAYPEELKLQIVEDAFLTGAGLSGQLDQILGKGNYRLELPQSDRYDQDHGQILQESKALEAERALIMKLNKDTKKHKVQRLIPGGQTINIHFFTHPNQHATGTLEVLDINGTTYHYNLDFFMPKLPEAKISRDLFSQKFNVLPSEGHRAHTIKV